VRGLFNHGSRPLTIASDFLLSLRRVPPAPAWDDGSRLLTGWSTCAWRSQRWSPRSIFRDIRLHTTHRVFNLTISSIWRTSFRRAAYRILGAAVIRVRYDHQKPYGSPRVLTDGPFCSHATTASLTSVSRDKRAQSPTTGAVVTIREATLRAFYAGGSNSTSRYPLPRVRPHVRSFLIRPAQLPGERRTPASCTGRSALHCSGSIARRYLSAPSGHSLVTFADTGDVTRECPDAGHVRFNVPHLSRSAPRTAVSDSLGPAAPRYRLRCRARKLSATRIFPRRRRR